MRRKYVKIIAIIRNKCVHIYLKNLQNVFVFFLSIFWMVQWPPLLPICHSYLRFIICSFLGVFYGLFRKPSSRSTSGSFSHYRSVRYCCRFSRFTFDRFFRLAPDCRPFIRAYIHTECAYVQRNIVIDFILFCRRFDRFGWSTIRKRTLRMLGRVSSCKPVDGRDSGEFARTRCR